MLVTLIYGWLYLLVGNIPRADPLMVMCVRLAICVIALLLIVLGAYLPHWGGAWSR
jgi:hypothetical protein